MTWLVLFAALAAGCSTPPRVLPERSYPTGNEAHVQALQPDMTHDQVRQAVGTEPVPNPADSKHPFSNPHLELVFEAPGERRVELWLYLTELRTHPACPELTWSELPVAFEDGRLVARSWSDVSARLEDWGRSADWYRKLRYPSFGRCGGRR